jgi:hypothetical protein
MSIRVGVLGGGAASAFYLAAASVAESFAATDWRITTINNSRTSAIDSIYGTLTRVELIATTGGATLTDAATSSSFTLWSTFGGAGQTSAGVSDTALIDADLSTLRAPTNGYVDAFGLRHVFPSATEVRGIRIQASVGGSSAYRVQRSLDSGATWQTLAITFATLPWDSGTPQEMMFVPSIHPSTPDINAARAWRIGDINQGSAFRVAEFICALTTGGASQCEGGAQTFSARGILVNHMPVSAAFDANTSTYWQANQNVSTVPLQLGYVFASTIDINQIRIQAAVSGLSPPGSFSLQYSNDLETWVTALATSGLSWSSAEVKSFSVG